METFIIVLGSVISEWQRCKVFALNINIERSYTEITTGEKWGNTFGKYTTTISVLEFSTNYKVH